MTSRCIRSLFAVLVAAAMAGVAPANSVGLARSSNAYNVERATGTLSGSPEMPFLVNEGDRLHAGDDILRVETTDGRTIILGRQSEVAVQNASDLSMENGRLAVALPEKQTTRIRVGNLMIEPIDADADIADRVGAVAVESTDEAIDVYTHGRTFAVTELPAGNQIAVLGDADAFRFVRADLGRWKPIAPLADVSADPTEKDEDEDQRDEGAAWWRNGGTSAATAAGTAGQALALGAVTAALIGWSVQGDDNKKDDNNNSFNPPHVGPSSQIIAPTPTPVNDGRQPAN